MWQCFLGIEWAEGSTVGKDEAVANLKEIAVPISRGSWRQMYGMNNKEELVDEYKEREEKSQDKMMISF